MHNINIKDYIMRLQELPYFIINDSGFYPHLLQVDVEVAKESCLQNAAVDVTRVDSESELQTVQQHYPFQ